MGERVPTNCGKARRIDLRMLKPDARLSVVVVGPRRIDWLSSPGRSLSDNDARAKLIIGKDTDPFRSVAQDQDQIAEYRFDLAVVIQIELGLPIWPLSAGAAAQNLLPVFFQSGETILDDLFE